MTLSDVKSALGRPVNYDGSTYTMIAYILRLGVHGPVHSAELLDKKQKQRRCGGAGEGENVL